MSRGIENERNDIFDHASLPGSLSSYKELCAKKAGITVQLVFMKFNG